MYPYPIKVLVAEAAVPGAPCAIERGHFLLEVRLRDVLVAIPEVGELDLANGTGQRSGPVLEIRHRVVSSAFSGKEERHRRRQEPLHRLVDDGQVPQKVLLIWKKWVELIKRNAKISQL